MKTYRSTTGAREERLRADYHGYTLERISSYAKIASIITLCVIPYFMYEDRIVSRLPEFSILFRLFPVILSVVLVIMVFSRLSGHLLVIRVLYFTYLTSLMIMMAGLLAITAGTDRYDLFVLGMTVIIFCIFGGSVYGSRLLVPVYFIPLAGVLVYLVLIRDLPTGTIAILSNPVATAIVCTVFAELQEKIRYREFISSRIMEVQNRQLEKELNLARFVQNNLVPTGIPETAGARFHSVYTPMIAIGGDFFDIIKLSDTKVGVFISDVSGHGVPAALISSMVKTLLNTAGDLRLDPGRLLHYINDQLIGQTGGHFVTAFYGVYDNLGKAITYARAGHSYPYLIRNGSVTELQSRGNMMGLFRGLTFDVAIQALAPGDRILFYTDGLIETVGSNGETFESMIHDELVKNSIHDNRLFVDTIYNSLMLFNESDRFNDDVCLIGMEVVD